MRHRVIPIVVLAVGLLTVGLLPGCPAQSDVAPSVADAPPVPDLPPLADADEPVRDLLAAAHAAARDRPDDPERRHVLGMALHANERRDAAADAYRAALALDDGSAPTWHLLGLLESDAGRLDEAAAAFARAAGIAPGFARRWRLGLVQLESGRFDAAASSFRAALAIDPADAAARLGLARALLAQGDLDAAERLLTSPDLEFDANAGYAAHLRREVRRRRGAVAADAVPAVSATPTWRDPWADDLVALRRGHGAEARRAEALLRAGAFTEAARLLADLHRRRPDDLVVAVNLALARRESGDVDGSLALLDAILREHPDHLPARFQSAVGLARRATEPDRPDAGASRLAAEAHLERILELNPGFAAAHGLRGDLHLMQRDAAAAFARYEDAARIDPDDPGWTWRAGLCLVMADRHDDAIPWLERTLALRPNHAEARRALAHAQASGGGGDR